MSTLHMCSQVKNWVKELRKMLGNDICLCIVGKSTVYLTLSIVIYSNIYIYIYIYIYHPVTECVYVFRE